MSHPPNSLPSAVHKLLVRYTSADLVVEVRIMPLLNELLCAS